MIHTRTGWMDMKILKIDNGQGFFSVDGSSYETIDKIDKDGLLKLVGLVLEEELEMDEYDQDKLQHQAHQIVYKSIYEKLSELEERKDEFKDESKRLYHEEYERYNVEKS